MGMKQKFKKFFELEDEFVERYDEYEGEQKQAFMNYPEREHKKCR